MAKAPEFEAEGREKLTEVLQTILQTSQKNPAFASIPHYILYKLYALESLLKVDMSQRPYHVWHYNLQERAALPSVKDAISQFLQEAGQEKDVSNCFHDIYEKLRQAKIDASMSGEVIPLPEDPLQHGFELLDKEKRPAMETMVIPAAKEQASGWFSFFKPETAPDLAAPKLGEHRDNTQKKQQK